jgi:hypothetical protein
MTLLVLSSAERIWLGDFKQGGYQPEISLSKEIAKVK